MMQRNDNLKRVIVDFKKLTPEILALLVERYPDGYDDDHIISFRNQHNAIIEAVEVTTSDTKYLVKVSSKLVSTMQNYDGDDATAVSNSNVNTIEPPEVGDDTSNNTND